MTQDVNSLRPSGIKRKLYQSAAIAVETAGDYVAAYFPHGVTLRGIWFVPTVAVGTADCAIDIGIAQNGDTIIDGYVLATSGSAIGTAVDVFQTKGTNGGLIILPPGTTVWVQSDGVSTGGTGYFIFEYEDDSN